MAYDETKLIKLGQMKLLSKKINELFARKSTLNALATKVEKLEEVGAQANVIESISINNNKATITNKNVNITVPTKTSDIENDKKYQTLTEVNTLIANAISESGHASFTKVTELPAVKDAKSNIIYLLHNEDTKYYDMYALIDNKLERLDDTSIDLTNYAQLDKVLYTNMTPTVSSHGGVAVGSTFNKVPITDMLTKILYPWVAPVVTTKVDTPSNGGTFEKGNNQTITSISTTITKKSAKITKVELFYGANSLGSKVDSDLNTINTSGSGSLTFTINQVVSSNSNFTIKVTDADNKVTSANTGTFTFVYPYYYGVINNSATINETTIKGLTKDIKTKGNKTYKYTSSNQKVIFATPVSYGSLTKILDPNSFDITSTFTKTQINITGLDTTSQAYYVYSNDPSTVTNFNITFNY